ncbi:MFS general substrate transporter [Mycena epipterygia]|nr:MFS general substrate transporter [Mycena epipterygia]KAJ7123508.1 MFS general substrate transporter [Mycena epipterygia]
MMNASFYIHIGTHRGGNAPRFPHQDPSNMEKLGTEILHKDPDHLPRDSASDSKVDEVVTTLPTQDVADPPDGGFRAFIVLCGTFAGFFATFGHLSSWGVFQEYYQQHQLHHSTPSQISWIGSISTAMLFLPSIVVGRLFDLGHYRIPFACGGILVVITTIVVPECKVYWHFMLCQGFGTGIGSGLMFCTMITLITYWYKKRRGFALGVSSGGGALGSTVFPIIIRQLITRVGFPWAMRTVGFIMAFVLIIANLCIAQPLPVRPVKASHSLLSFRVFRSGAFSLLCLSTVILFLGLFTILTYITSSAIAFGISPNFAFYLVAVVNFSSGVGRIVSGLLGDRYGSMNVMVIMTTLAGVTTFAWPFCRTIPTIIVISILYGFFSGAWIALIGSTIGQMGGMEDIGSRVGAMNTVAGLGTLCGPPISGAFVGTALGYTAVGYFSGSAQIVGTFLMFISRLLAAPGLWRKY